MLISLLLPVSVALAQDVVAGGEAPDANLQTFRPSMDSHDFFRVIDTDLPVNGFSASGLFSYSADPLQYRRWDGSVVDVSGDILQLDAMASVRLGSLRLGVDAPIYLQTFGGQQAGASGLGDLALEAKWRMADPSTAPVGVALLGRRVFATATAGEGLGAARGGWDLAMALDKSFDKIDVVANAGTVSQRPVSMEGADWGSQLFGQLGVSWHTTDNFGLVGELYGARVLGSSSEASSPLEGLVGANIRSGRSRGFTIRPAVGYGLRDAVGTPRVRGLLSFGWDPLSPVTPKDRDKDGIVDSADACPSVPEDVDAYEDSDGCADPTLVRVRVIDSDGIELLEAPFKTSSGASGKAGPALPLDAGKYTFSAGGVDTPIEVPGGAPFDVQLKVPAPRTPLHVEAKDGKGRPVADVTWSATGPLPLEGFGAADLQIRPGAYAFEAKAPGYRTAKVSVETAKEGTTQVVFQMEPLKAQLVGQRIEIKESVYFETMRSEIKAESFGLLDEVAQVLLDHPELTKVRVEGHTDSRGDDKLNLELSKSRAQAVAAYLVTKGVAADRIESEGYGETRPLVKGKNAAAYEKNRRVDFRVVGRSDMPAKPTKPSKKAGDKPEGKAGDKAQGTKSGAKKAGASKKSGGSKSGVSKSGASKSGTTKKLPSKPALKAKPTKKSK